MALLRDRSIPTPAYRAAHTPEEARAAAAEMQQGDPSREFVVKAQVLAGGRGLGRFKENGFQGGVHGVRTPEEAATIAEKMLGNTLQTKQTGERGRICNVVALAEKMKVKREMYFAILLDRASGGPILIGRCAYTPHPPPAAGAGAR